MPPLHSRVRVRILGPSLALLLAACTTTPPAPPPAPPPVRFAVVAAPEVGRDPEALGALQSAMTRVTVFRGLAFVVVPGPLLAAGAGREALDDLKATLDYSTVPLYVSFAPVGSAATPEGSVGKDDVLAALEARGPGPARHVVYRASPATAPDVSVVGLGPDGRPPVEPAAPRVRLSVAFAATGVEPHPDLVADVIVRSVEGAGGVSLTTAKSGAVVVSVPPVHAAAAIVVVTCDGGETSAVIVPFDTKAKPPPPPPPVRLPERKGRLVEPG